MKLKLDNESIAQDFFEDAVLLGIVAPVKDYQFSWQLNQLLGFGFRRNNDFEIQLNKRNRTYYFAIYEFALPSSGVIHYLYNNECEGEYLLPEFRHLDFVWLIKGEYISPDELNVLMQSVKSLPVVQLISEMTNEKIKHKQHLIF